jgi:hypothetical protein
MYVCIAKVYFFSMDACMLHTHIHEYNEHMNSCTHLTSEQIFSCGDVLCVGFLCADCLCAVFLCADFLCDFLCAGILCAVFLSADFLCEVLCADVLYAEFLCDVLWADMLCAVLSFRVSFCVLKVYMLNFCFAAGQCIQRNSQDLDKVV